MVFDVLPGCAQLAVAADAAVADDRFDGISVGELVGVLCAWDRVEAHAAARKLAVVAEFTADEIAYALGESRTRGYDLMGTAGHLDTHLPGTKAARHLRLRTPGGGPDLIIALDPLTTDPCDHRFESRGHDPGVRLRHLSQVRHASCTSPVCRRPASRCDFEHNTPYEAGGRTCLCNAGPRCKR